jgi:hypothetical protein
MTKCNFAEISSEGEMKHHPSPVNPSVYRPFSVWVKLLKVVYVLHSTEGETWLIVKGEMYQNRN